MSHKTLYAFTSAACNYLPKVRLLIQSLRRYHPEFRVVLALSDLVDDSMVLGNEGWDEIMPIDTLDIPDWRRWAFTHDIVELSTAIKPFVLQRLLERPDCGGVFYFDPDIVLFSQLDDLVAKLNEFDVLLTPHQTKPEVGLAEVMDNEICSLKHGVYNLGFIGVRPSDTGKAFARWWSNRVYHFCRDDIPNGLFTDQRWIDLAPALFDGVGVLRESRFNVAPWNLTTRMVSGSQLNGFHVNDKPLGFYHFTGFDSGAHRIMVWKYCATNAAVNELVSWYETATSDLRADPLSSRPWGFQSFGDGIKITRAHRTIYRSRADLQHRYADPFAASTGDDSTFAGWCQCDGVREYPALLPLPTKDADWSTVSGSLVPSITPVAGGTPSWITIVKRIIKNPKQMGLFWAAVSGVLCREGVGGVMRRLRQRR